MAQPYQRCADSKLRIKPCEGNNHRDGGGKARGSLRGLGSLSDFTSPVVLLRVFPRDATASHLLHKDGAGGRRESSFSGTELLGLWLLPMTENVVPGTVAPGSVPKHATASAVLKLPKVLSCKWDQSRGLATPKPPRTSSWALHSLLGMLSTAPWPRSSLDNYIGASEPHSASSSN